jgi:hypothetical protein
VGFLPSSSLVPRIYSGVTPVICWAVEGVRAFLILVSASSKAIPRWKHAYRGSLKEYARELSLQAFHHPRPKKATLSVVTEIIYKLL